MTDDGFEQRIADAFKSRSDSLGRRTGDLSDVIDRAEHRNTRRRTVATGGSLAVVTIGVIGLAALAGRGDTPVGFAGQGDATAAASTATTTTTIDSARSWVWQCVEPLDAPDDGGSYFRHCEEVLIEGVRPPVSTLVDNGEAQRSTPVTTAIEQLTYRVQVGDSVASIAARFGVSMEELVRANEWPDGVNQVILPDTSIVLPASASPTTTTTTEPG